MSDESPQQRVDYYTEAQVRERASTGGKIDAEAIRRNTAALLQMADAETSRTVSPQRDGDGKTGAEVIAKKRELTGEGLAESTKMDGVGPMQFFYRDEREEKLITAPVKAKVPSGLEGEKHFALMRRITLLMERIPGYVRKPNESIFAAHVYPRLAQLLAMSSQHAALESPEPWAGKGKYHGLNRSDRQRRYYAELERICNLSNAAVMGPGWWISR